MDEQLVKSEDCQCFLSDSCGDSPFYLLRCTNGLLKNDSCVCHGRSAKNSTATLCYRPFNVSDIDIHTKNLIDKKLQQTQSTDIPNKKWHGFVRFSNKSIEKESLEKFSETYGCDSYKLEPSDISRKALMEVLNGTKPRELSLSPFESSFRKTHKGQNTTMEFRNRTNTSCLDANCNDFNDSSTPNINRDAVNAGWLFLYLLIWMIIIFAVSFAILKLILTFIERPYRVRPRRDSLRTIAFQN